MLCNSLSSCSLVFRERAAPRPRPFFLFYWCCLLKWVGKRWLIREELKSAWTCKGARRLAKFGNEGERERGRRRRRRRRRRLQSGTLIRGHEALGWRQHKKRAYSSTSTPTPTPTPTWRVGITAYLATIVTLLKTAAFRILVLLLTTHNLAVARAHLAAPTRIVDFSEAVIMNKERWVRCEQNGHSDA